MLQEEKIKSVGMKDYSIQVDALSRHFGNFKAVDQISMKVNRGEIFGFLGANGAGKTTAIKMLCGLLRPTSGKALVAGFDVYKESEKIKQRIGYMSQRFSLYEDLTISENIRFYGGIYGLTVSQINERGTAALKRLELFNDRKMLVHNLPLGWKQKLAFSVASLHKPSIIFLDEPTSGVDPITRRQFWDMIYEEADKGTTIFITTHYMEEAEYCERISMMVAGKIQALDTPGNLRQKYKVASMDEVFLKIARTN